MPDGIDDFSPRITYGATRQIEAAAVTPEGHPLPAITDSGCEPDDCITSTSAVGVAPLGALVQGGAVYDDVDALPPDLTEEQGLAASYELVDVLARLHAVDLILDARFDEVDQALRQACGASPIPAPAPACLT